MQLDNVKSSSHAVTSGIPQGSVVNPLPFNININGITKVSTKFDFILYGNHTALSFTIENFGNITDVANLKRELYKETLKIYCLLLTNIPTLKAGKLKFMIFFKSPKVLQMLNLAIA